MVLGRWSLVLGPDWLRSLTICIIALVSVPGLFPACSSASSPPQRQGVTIARQVGSWQGTGNRTIGFASESGIFRVSWKARDRHPPASGSFLLTIRSAISGRPIQVVADHHGDGSGSIDFSDDPRLYDLVVDSADADWSIAVEELAGVPASEPPVAPPRNP